jgi:hypothetical protein
MESLRLAKDAEVVGHTVAAGVVEASQMRVMTDKTHNRNQQTTSIATNPACVADSAIVGSSTIIVANFNAEAVVAEEVEVEVMIITHGKRPGLPSNISTKNLLRMRS